MTELAHRHAVIPLTVKWPQDNLRIPDSGGFMPDVDPYNARVTRREYQGRSASVASISYGGAAQLSLPTQQSGDYYASSFAISVIDNNGPGQLFNAQLWGTVKIIDARTAFDYTYGGVSLSYFSIPPTYPVGSMRMARRSDFIQPMIFTRNGAILIEVAISPRAGVAAHSYRLDMVFDGWIEYEYASH